MSRSKQQYSSSPFTKQDYDYVIYNRVRCKSLLLFSGCIVKVLSWFQAISFTSILSPYVSVVLLSFTLTAEFSFSIFVPVQQYRSLLLKKTYSRSRRIVVSMNEIQVNKLLQWTSKIKKESIPSHFTTLLCYIISIPNYLRYCMILST